MKIFLRDGLKRRTINADKNYIILIALAKVVTTKGSESQNHGLKLGITSMIIITIAEIKKYNHHFPDPSVVFI